MKNRLVFPLWLLAHVQRLVQAQNAEAWASLNASVGGRLHPDTPLALPCFSLYNGNPVELDEGACSVVRENYTTNSIRAEHPGAYMNLQSEFCLSEPEDQCALDSTVLPALPPAPGASCNQGSVPSYYIRVQGASDIRKAFEFSREHGVPLSIKNSGHDFMTRNSQKDSLALWVQGLDGLTYHDDFVPEGCDASSPGVGRAVTVETGASTQDIFSFASSHGSMFIGGYTPTVAASGGWVLGGGHSVLSPVYGLGVDRVVQFKILTPDGALRVVNRCQHEDLFWALRGGGIGTFGVALEATHRVEPSAPIAVANIRLPRNATMDTSLKWVEQAARDSLRWGRQGWGGHLGGLYLTYMNPVPAIANLSDGNAAAQESMRNATEFALSLGGTSVVEVLPNYMDVWNKYILPGALATAGTVRLGTSRLIPQRLFADDAGIAKIMDFLSATRDAGFDPRQLYLPIDTPFVAEESQYANPTDVRPTPAGAVNPVWYDSLWHVTLSRFVPWNATYAERLQSVKDILKVTRLGEELTGADGGAYVNEADPFTQDWRQAWWGDNYARLVEIRNKYDPEGLLQCWKCVGFEDEDVLSERFKCQGKLQRDADSGS